MRRKSPSKTIPEEALLTERVDLYSRFFDLLERAHHRNAEESQADLKKEIQEHIMRDLEDLYLHSKALGNMTAALKAKELQGKNVGMFGLEKNTPQEGIPVKPLATMSLDELKRVISGAYQEMGIDVMTPFEK